MWIKYKIFVPIFFLSILLLSFSECKKKEESKSEIGHNNLKIGTQTNDGSLCFYALPNSKKGHKSLHLFLRKEFNIEYSNEELEFASWSPSMFFLTKDIVRTRRPHSEKLYEFKVSKDDLGILTLERNGKYMYLSSIVTEVFLSKSKPLEYWIYADYSEAKSAVIKAYKDAYRTTEIGYFKIDDRYRLESECLNQKEIDENYDQAVLEKSQGPEPTDEFSN